jgi:hypothetical protein
MGEETWQSAPPTLLLNAHIFNMCTVHQPAADMRCTDLLMHDGVDEAPEVVDRMCVAQPYAPPWKRGVDPPQPLVVTLVHKPKTLPLRQP